MASVGFKCNVVLHWQKLEL